MSLTQLHLIPVLDTTMSCAVGQVMPLDDPQLSLRCIALLDDRVLIDLPTRTLVLDRNTGVILDIIESEGLTLLGVDEDGLIGIFSDDLSWNYQTYPFAEQAFLDNDDPDFPRFTLEEDSEGAWLFDMDTTIRYRLEELALDDTRRSA
jgi:hypothetical protein